MFSNNPKYIVFNGTEMVIFPNHIQHIHVAFNNKFLGEPTSAGFITKDFECYGESNSLELTSKPTDSILAKKYFRM